MTVKCGLLAALLIYTYYPTLVWMVDRWSARDSYYGHGFLIPAVTLYWIWRKRKSLAEAAQDERPDFLAAFLLLAGGGLQIFAAVFRVYFLSAFSLVPVLMGMVGLAFGRRTLREVWFPLCFLALAVPLPLLVISQTTLKMKFFVSEIAASLIRFTGIPATRQGSYLVTPNSYLLVGDPCSGLRSFLAFICLGFVFAYESRLAVWQRMIIVFSGLPLAVISNVIRVYSLGLLSEFYGMHAVEGWVHDASGIVVFVFALGVLMILKNKMEARHAHAV